METENTWAGPPPVQSQPIMCFTWTEPPRRNTAPKLSFLAIANSYARREKNPGIGQGARGGTLVRTSRRPWARSFPHRTHHGAREGALAPRRNTTCLVARNEAGRQAGAGTENSGQSGPFVGRINGKDRKLRTGSERERTWEGRETQLRFGGRLPADACPMRHLAPKSARLRLRGRNVFVICRLVSFWC